MLNSFRQRGHARSLLGGRALRLLLLCAALFQALLPMAAQAAMRSADVSSPYYCGQMSPQLSQQLRAMDLPAELLQQLLPASAMADGNDCELCAAGLFAIANAAELEAPKFELFREQLALQAVEPRSTFFSRYSARAPPQ
jgi:hypothetical protein